MVPDTQVLGCKNETFDFRGCLGISRATRHGVVSRKTLRKKTLVQQTITSRWWCVVTVRPLQTISRYATLWFWEFVCPAALRSLRVLGNSPVCRAFCYPEKQWSLDHFDFWFSFFQYDMVTHPWCYCSHVGLTRMFSFNVGSFFAMSEPLASQLWNLWSCELWWVRTFTDFNFAPRSCI